MILERLLPAALTMASVGLFWRGLAVLRGRDVPRGHRVYLLASVFGGVMGILGGHRLLTAPVGAEQALAALCRAPLSWWWASQLWLIAPVLVLLLAIHREERQESLVVAGLGLVVSWASALGLSLAWGRLDTAASETPATSLGVAILAVAVVGALPMIPDGSRLPVLAATGLMLLLPLAPLGAGPRIAPRRALLALGAALLVVRLVQSAVLLGALPSQGLGGAFAAHTQALEDSALLARLHWDYIATCAVVGAFLVLRAGRRGVPWIAAAFLFSPPVVLAVFLGASSLAVPTPSRRTGAGA